MTATTMAAKTVAVAVAVAVASNVPSEEEAEAAVAVAATMLSKAEALVRCARRARPDNCSDLPRERRLERALG